MIPFLVKAEVRRQDYPDSDRIFTDMRVVMAFDEAHAKAKYTLYWESQSADYDVSFWVLNSEVIETIQ